MEQDNKKNQQLGQIKNMLMLAVADNRFGDEELAAIATVAAREQITPEEFNRVMDNPDSVTIELPTDPDSKRRYLKDMVTLMIIDGELHEDEMAMCKIYAMALGYAPTVANEMLAEIIDEIG